MNGKETGEIYVHRIDEADTITRVSDNWLQFAEENLASISCSPENVVGRSLWDFVQDKETRHLYEMILTRARNTDRTYRFPFRCDAPHKRRYLEMTVVPLKEGAVEFKSEILREEEREPVELLDKDLERTEDLVKICSMCKKIALPDNRWVEVEEAVACLDLFGKPRLPRLSHGICPPCFDRAISEMDA